MKKEKNIFIGSSFIAGFVLMTVELVATRLMAPYVGSSIYTWTSVIGVILLGMAIGNYAGGIYVDRHGSRKKLAQLFGITSVVTFFIPLAAYFSPILALSGLPISVIPLLLATVLFLVPAIFFGTLYPGILKLHLQSVEATGTSSGQISAAWSLGSIVGTFLTGFYFIGYIGSGATILLVSLLLLVNASALHGLRKKTMAVITMLFLIVGIATYGMHVFTDVRGKVFAAESEYYAIKVIDGAMEGKGRVRALFLDVDSHSLEGLDGQRLNIYPEIYPIFGSINKSIRDVLVLGGGSYALSKNIAQAYEGSRITTVEIDPKVREVAENYFRLKEYPIRTEIADGRVFLQRTNDTYDLIFSDAYNSFISVPWHMATVEFTTEVRDHLNKGGIYAVNFSSTLSGEDAGLFKSMQKTFSTVFGQYMVFAYGKNEYEPQNIILVGVHSDQKIDVDAIKQRIAQGENGEFLVQLLKEQPEVSVDVPLLTDDYAPVERLMKPLMSDYFKRYMPLYYSMLFAAGSE